MRKQDDGLFNVRLDRFEGKLAIGLFNGLAALRMETKGCMTPVFAFKDGSQLTNTHWTPAFRLPDAVPRGEGLLGYICGEFPCCPTFGPGCTVRGAAIPTHGWTSSGEWSLDGFGMSSERGEVCCDLSLESPAPELPLSWRRRIVMLEGQSAYYSLISVRNRGPEPLRINIGHHNTVGLPFLEAGCRISLSANRFMVPPEGSEFDATGRLVPGAEFGSLAEAPLRKGGVADISQVPGIIGATDFVTGAIPPEKSLGWSCVVNPRLGLAYICFFPGDWALPPGEVALGFNDLWMQYGGRRFKPWAAKDGAEDLTLCLGTENATGAFANGLEYSLGHPEILGRPTTIEVPARGERRLYYGTAIVALEPAMVREGVRRLIDADDAIIIEGKKAHQRLKLEASFDRLREFLNWPDARDANGGI